MTEIERIEQEIKNFDKSGYLISSSNNGREITYTIVSEYLKKSLRSILHSTRKWQIEYVIERGNITEFATEGDDKFGLYQKYSDEEFDKFTVLKVNDQNRNNFSSPIEKKRERVIRLFWENEESKRRVEEARRRHEARQNGLDYENGDYVSYTFQTNEKGEWVGEKKENFADPNQKGLVKEGLGYKTAQQAFSILVNEGVFPVSSNRLLEQGEKETETNGDDEKKSRDSESGKRSHKERDEEEKVVHGGKKIKIDKKKTGSHKQGQGDAEELRQKNKGICLGDLIRSGKEFVLNKKRQFEDTLEMLMRAEIDEFEREQKISEVKSNLELVEEALKIIKNSETNESLDSGNYFLTPWIIGGSATVLAVGLLGVIITRNFRGKRGFR